MIDVKLIPNTNYYDDMLMATKILQWIASLVALEKEKNDLMMKGFIVLCDEGRVSTLLITNPEHEKRLLQILQEPPGEYKDKYVACILSEEPKVVEEKCETDSDGDSDDVPIEVEET